jgi:hypothetical protein
MEPRDGSHIWEVRCPEGGTAGSEFARAILAGGVTSVLVHAPPSTIDVEVRGPDSAVLARGTTLTTDLASPMARLRIEGARITREQLWPSDADLGSIVILPGGEAGELRSWWHAEDHRSWRWLIQFDGKS